MPARTTSSRFHPQPPSVPPMAKMTVTPSRARPVPPTIPRPAGGSSAMAPGSQPAAKPAIPLLSVPAAANPPAHFRTSRSPTFCWSAPAVAQSALSAPTSGWHTAPASCRSGSLASHPPPPLAAQTARPAAAPPAPPYLKRDTAQPPSAAHCRFADRCPELAGIPSGRRPSSPSAKASPPFLRGGLLRHDLDFPAWAVLGRTESSVLILGFAPGAINAVPPVLDYESHVVASLPRFPARRNYAAGYGKTQVSSSACREGLCPVSGDTASLVATGNQTPL